MTYTLSRAEKVAFDDLVAEQIARNQSVTNATAFAIACRATSRAERNITHDRDADNRRYGAQLRAFVAYAKAVHGWQQ